MKMNITEMDQLVHNLIHKLLVMSEEDSKKVHSVHLHGTMEKHQALIQSVKEKIKPGLIAVYFKSFDRQMVKDYLNTMK